MEKNLPKGWIECKLGDVCSKPQYGWTSKAGKSGRIKYLRTTDISDGSLNWDEVPFCIEEPGDIEKYQVRENDILVSRAGSVGLSFRIKGDVSFDAVFASYLIRFKSYDDATARLLEYFLQSKLYWDQISDFTAGIAIPNVNASKLEELSIPLPPLPEQQRIVEKLDSLMARISNSKTRLEKIPTLLKNFRQSVLAAAVSGELTKEWREDDEEIAMFPLGDLIDDLKYGTSQKSEYKEEGVPVLRIPNIIEDGKISNENLKYSSLPKKEYEKLKLQEGDILLIRSNGSVSLVGKTSIVTKDQVGFAYAGYLIRIRCNQKKLIPLFLNHVMASHDVRSQIEIEARSTSGVNNINTEEVKALVIPAPSIEEQKEIVRKVEELFHFADSIEARYQKAKAWFDKLPQAILAKAFRGELVPQNQNDEPASELLKRIQNEKNIISKSPKTAVLKAKKGKSYRIDEDEELRMVAEE